MGQSGHSSKDFERGMERVSGAWPSVEAVGNGIEIVLGEGAQAYIGQVLAQQAVGVLACAALPGTVGVAEVDRHAGSGGEILVASQLFALIVGQAVTQWCGDRNELGREAGQRRGGRGVFHAGQLQISVELHERAGRIGYLSNLRKEHS